MSNTQLTGVVAHIVSHAVGVVNDKAALTQRLTSMGAAVASRFSGLVTHVIFRRKPQATKEERLAEDQALWELYARIDKAAQPTYGAAQIHVVEPFWIEACFSSRMPALEKPYLLPRPDPFLHLPRSKTPGSSAGKKRRRQVQQPKPVQKYDLDVGGFEFSSTQKMHDEEPLQSASVLRREGPYGQALQTEICPGSAGSVPAMHNDEVIDLTAARPSSAPSHLEGSSQVAVEPEHEIICQLGKDTLTATHSLSRASLAQDNAPEGECDQQQPQLGQPAMAGSEEFAVSRSPLTASNTLQQQQLQGAERATMKSSLLGLPASHAQLCRASVQPSPAATLEDDAVKGHQALAAACTPVTNALAQAGVCQKMNQQQQQVAEQTTPHSTEVLCHKPPHLSGLSRACLPLCTPGPLNSPGPLQGLTLPTLRHASASANVQRIPALASRLSTAQQQPSHQMAGTLQPVSQLAALDGRRGVGPRDPPLRADSAGGGGTPLPLSIPKLKATPAPCMGQSPLAFPRLSPAPARPAHTPQIKADRPANFNSRLGRLSAAPDVAQETMQQQSAGDGLTCTPLLRSSDAAACQPHAHASMQGHAAHDGLGFGSPLLIEDTPQNLHFSGHEKPEVASDPSAMIPTKAPVAPSPCAQHALPAASQGAPASATQHQSVSHVRGGIAEPLQHTAAAAQHLQGPAEGESSERLQKASAAKRYAARRGRRHRKGSAAQQENAGAACQQPAGPAEQRQPLVSMDSAVLGFADGSGVKDRGMKRHRVDQHASKERGAHNDQKMLEAGMGTVGADGVGQEEGICAKFRSKSSCPAAPQHIPSAKRPAVLALSSVSDADAKAAAKAVKRLGDMRLCAIGNEDHVTHLVMGSPRRTLKVLLAIAAGAWLLMPDWIAASAAAGIWLDEHEFKSETPFASAAARSREHAALGRQPLLAGKAVHIVKGAGATQIHDGAVALTRIALAHGAKVTGLRQCDICIVCRGGTPPDATKCPVAVRESWLLDLAALFEVPKLSDAYYAQQPVYACS